VNVPELTAEQFRCDVQQAGATALLECWADWCVYCRLVKPKMQTLARQYVDRPLLVGRVDVETHTDVAAQLHVDMVPMVVLVQQGQPVRWWPGDRPLTTFTEVLDRRLPEREPTE